MVYFTPLRPCLKAREAFKFPAQSVLHWFPGHMGKGLKVMQQKLKTVDCVIEVHDARIPLSGRNPQFRNTVIGPKPHILVLNKKDLADLGEIGAIEQRLKTDGLEDVIFTNCKDQTCKGVNKVVPKIKELVSSSNRYNRSEEEAYRVMVIGVPNVGKSSLINVLRNKNLKKRSAAPVGAVAGITKSVMADIKVSSKPLIYILDTPGILTPNIPNLETGLKLALCATMKDHLVGTEIIADYLLYWLNKYKNYKYVEYLGLKKPSDDIMEVLLCTAHNLGKTVKIRDFQGGYKTKLDTDSASIFFLKGFRSGMFGKVILDDPDEASIVFKQFPPKPSPQIKE